MYTHIHKSIRGIESQTLITTLHEHYMYTQQFNHIATLFTKIKTKKRLKTSFNIKMEKTFTQF